MRAGGAGRRRRRSRRARRSATASRTRTRPGSSTATSSRRTSSSRTATAVSARVLDFGLALMGDAETLTEQGDVPGTLAYISPERLAGGDATAAADVWAVGVMLWEALAGRHPFWRGSMLETARAIEAGARPLGEVRPELPKRLLRLVDRALSQDPGKRPSRARARRRAARRGLRRPRAPRPGFKLPSRDRAADRAHGRPRGASSPAGPPRRSRSSRPAGRSCSRWPPSRRRSSASASGSRSRSPCRSSRSATSRSGSRSSTPPSPPAARRDVAGAAGDAPLRARAAARAALRARPAAARDGAHALGARRASLTRARRAHGRGRRRDPPRDAAARRRPGAARARASPARVTRSTSPARSPTPPPRTRRSSSRPAPSRRRARAAACARQGAAGAPGSARRCSRVASPCRPVRRSRARRCWLAASAPMAAFSALRAPARGYIPPRAEVLRAIEQRLERVFEGVFGRAFRTNVQPVELARKLAKEMDEHRSTSVTRIYVPNEYTIYLSSGDREQFEGYENSLVVGARGVPHRARRARELRAAHAAARPLRDRRRPRRRRVRDRDADGAARPAAPARRRRDAVPPPGATMIYKPRTQPTEAVSLEELGVEREVGVLTWGGERRVLDKQRAVLGRSRDVDVQIEDPNVSRRHAEVVQQGSTCWVIDLGSTNGSRWTGAASSARSSTTGRASSSARRRSPSRPSGNRSAVTSRPRPAVARSCSSSRSRSSSSSTSSCGASSAPPGRSDAAGAERRTA